MLQKISVYTLSRSIEPLCPRDSHVMRYDPNGLDWRPEEENRAVPSYRCGYEGCGVLYTPDDGYFTVIMMPDLAQPVEEPGVNLLQCPRHDAWLYRGWSENVAERLVWRCGVEGCDYTHSDFGPAWPSL